MALPTSCGALQSRVHFDGDTSLPSTLPIVTLFFMISWIQCFSVAFYGVSPMIQKRHSSMRQARVVMQFIFLAVVPGLRGGVSSET